MWHFPDARTAAQSKNLGLAIENAPMRSRNFGCHGSIGQSDDRDRNLAAGSEGSSGGEPPVNRDDPVDLSNLADEIARSTDRSRRSIGTIRHSPWIPRDRRTRSVDPRLARGCEASVTPSHEPSRPPAIDRPRSRIHLPDRAGVRPGRARGCSPSFFRLGLHFKV